MPTVVAAADPTANGCIATERSATATRRNFNSSFPAEGWTQVHPFFFASRERGDGLGGGAHTAVVRAVRGGKIFCAGGLAGEEQSSFKRLREPATRAHLSRKRIAVRTADVRRAGPVRTGEW